MVAMTLRGGNLWLLVNVAVAMSVAFNVMVDGDVLRFRLRLCWCQYNTN